MALELFAISPGIGHTGGRTYVELSGAEFRVPVVQPVGLDGIVPEPPPTMRVLFGGLQALQVIVVSETQAFCTTPAADEGGPADVVVQNLDDSGAVIATATLPTCWHWRRPDLNEQSDLSRVVRAFIVELKRQILPNVNWPSSTDYDDTSGDLLNEVKLAKLPALVIASTSIEDNVAHGTSEPMEIEDPSDPNGFVTMAAPIAVDIVMAIVGVSDNSVELINLASAVRRFFRKNPRITVDRDPEDASAGTVAYDIQWDASPIDAQIGASADNLRTFSGSARIVGFGLEQLFGFGAGGPGTPTQGHEAVQGTGRTMETLQLEPPTQKPVSSE